MFRPLYLCLMSLLFVSLGWAQTPQPVPTQHDGKIPANTFLTDSHGREIRNGGMNANGHLEIVYTGKLSKDSNGNLVCSGEIISVTNPASQGSEGPIWINTNGEPTVVRLDRNGIDPGSHLDVTVLGDHANIGCSGNFNDIIVGGTGNIVNITGNHNLGTGQGSNSGGAVIMAGRGNSWNSNGGNWTVRN